MGVPVLMEIRGAAMPDPYTGETHLEGTYGVAAVGGGRVEMELPPDAILVCTYRVRGKPKAAGWASGHRKWHLPDIGVEIRPVDDSTPRLQSVRPERSWMGIEINRRGYSHKAFAWFTAPAPGGRFRAEVTGAVADHEAHVVIAPPPR